MAEAFDINYVEKDDGPRFYRNWILSLPVERKRFLFDQLQKQLIIEPPLSRTTFKDINENDRKKIYNKYVAKKENVQYADFVPVVRSKDFLKKLAKLKNVPNYMLDFILIEAIRKDLNLNIDKFQGITKKMVELNKEYLPRQKVVQDELENYVAQDIVRYVYKGYEGGGDISVCKKCKKFKIRT